MTRRTCRQAAVSFLAQQIEIDDARCLADYAKSEGRWRHTTEIRDRYGFRAFSEPFIQWRAVPVALCPMLDRNGFDRASFSIVPQHG